MDVQVNELSTPIKFIVTEKAEIVDEKKKKIYEKVKDSIKLEGFRPGTVPQEVAEQKTDVFTLYKEIIDELFIEVQKKYDIVVFKDFKIYNNTFKKGKDLKIEFIGEVKPKVLTLPNLEDIDMKYEKDIKVEKEDIDKALELALKEREVCEPTDKQILENLDIAVIDFTGYLEGSKEPFKNGSTKNYQFCLNEIGKKQFIDNFEDQLVGMKVGETREVNVTFPIDYRDTTKAGKKARFEVKLITIKKVTRPELNDEFAKSKGFESLETYKAQIEKNTKFGKQNGYMNDFKRDVINQVTEATKISPIPQGMFDNEFETEWSNFLRRMGKTEKEYLKDNEYGKEYFKINNESRINETIKLSLTLEALAKREKIHVEKQEVLEYVENTASILGYDKTKTEKLIKDLEDENHYIHMAKAALNEKIVNYVFNYFKNKN